MNKNKINYHGYKLLLPSFLGLYSIFIAIYCTSTLHTMLRLFPLLTIMPILVWAALLVLLRAIGYSFTKDIKSRLKHLTVLWPMRVLCVASTLLCIFVHFYGTEYEYDLSVLTEDETTTYFYDTAVWVMPILPSVGKNSMQALCDSLQVVYDATSDILVVIEEYKASGIEELPEDDIKELKERYGDITSEMDMKSRALKKDAIVLGTVIGLNLLLRLMTNYLLYQRYRRLENEVCV